MLCFYLYCSTLFVLESLPLFIGIWRLTMHDNSNTDYGWNMGDPMVKGCKCSRKTETSEPRFRVEQVIGLAVGGIGQIVGVGEKGKYTVRIRTANGLKVVCLKEFELTYIGMK
jgi:hypothetical protein